MSPRSLSRLVMLAALAAACGTRELADGLPHGDPCRICHGNEDNAAPPRSGGIDKKTHTRDIQVGAHQLHVRDNNVRKAIACTECHVVPKTVDAPGHIGPWPAPVLWGPLSDGRGSVQPQWDRANAKCANTYCHGATLQGGTRKTPGWTFEQTPEWVLTQTEETCQGCHGSPPPAPHPQSDKCSQCHPLTVKRDGTINLEAGRHINGTVEAAGGDCNSCHGGPQNAAPPKDLWGGTETTARGVGAHQAHLRASDWHADIGCNQCHLVPALVDDPGHLDTDLPAELVWQGGLATARGAVPQWDGNRCASTYCHGARSKGGTLTAPGWTKVGQNEAACGTCHAVPPANHYGANCAGCHPDVTSAEGGAVPKIVEAQRALHINGRLDVNGGGGCGTCHGAPPDSGSHRAHYGDASATPLAMYGDTQVLADYYSDGKSYYMYGCGNCHPIDENRHMDGSLQVELHTPGAPGGSLKAMTPASARYDGNGGSCSNVYCHSSGQLALNAADPGRYFKTTPRWQGGASLGCNGCHDNPPRYESGGAGTATANTHVVLSDNGTEYGHFDGNPAPHGNHAPGDRRNSNALTCQACHYESVDPDNTGPSGFYWLDTTGDYILPNTGSRYRCTNCHSANDPAAPTRAGKAWPLRHVNGRRDVKFDPRRELPAYPTAPNAAGKPYWYQASAVVGNSQFSQWDLSEGTYDASTKTCSNIACHLEEKAPRWGVTPIGYATCNNCHNY